LPGSPCLTVKVDEGVTPATTTAYSPVGRGVVEVTGMYKVPLGTSNGHHVATLAGLQVGREEYTTSGAGRKITSGDSAAPT